MKKRYTCETCGRLFYPRKILLKTRPFVCDPCFIETITPVRQRKAVILPDVNPLNIIPQNLNPCPTLLD